MMMIIKTTDELLALAKNGHITIDEDCTIECGVPWYGIGDQILSLDVRGNLFVGGYLYVRGKLDVGGNLDVRGYLYWSHASMPIVGGAMKHKRVLPPSWQRDHWAERLGLSMDGCYDEIIDRLQPELPRLLASDNWSKTERWILESLQEKGE
jgi:hypothetical protein